MSWLQKKRNRNASHANRRRGYEANIRGEYAERLVHAAANKAGCDVMFIPKGMRVQKVADGLIPIPVKTPCDCIIFKNTHAVAIDVKIKKNGNFSYSELTLHQVDELHRVRKNVSNSGYVILFEEVDRVCFFNAEILRNLSPRESLKPDEGLYLGTLKSFDINLLFNNS